MTAPFVCQSTDADDRLTRELRDLAKAALAELMRCEPPIMSETLIQLRRRLLDVKTRTEK
jgi:hypothetical protein